jgi:hypothetical protein
MRPTALLLAAALTSAASLPAACPPGAAAVLAGVPTGRVAE